MISVCMTLLNGGITCSRRAILGAALVVDSMARGGGPKIARALAACQCFSTFSTESVPIGSSMTFNGL